MIKKLRVLHAASMLEYSAGIFTQMQIERNAAHVNGIAWDTRIFCPLSIIGNSEILVKSGQLICKTRGNWSIYHQIKFNLAYNRWLKSQEKYYDIILLRHKIYSFSQLYFLLTKRCNTYLVHHTLEIPELSTIKTFSFITKKIMESILGVLSIRTADGIFGVTSEIVQYEKKRAWSKNLRSFVYPNGIEYKDGPLEDRRENIPEFIFIASYFSSWHGLDKLIESAKKSQIEFIVHIVGNVDDSDFVEGKKDSRFIFHGERDSHYVQCILAKCWIGFGSFALDRKQMTQACTLKVREYLVSGIPVFSGHTDVFPVEFPYYISGSVVIERIVDFAQQHRHTSRLTVAMAAKKYIEKSSILQMTYDQLSTLQSIE